MSKNLAKSPAVVTRFAPSPTGPLHLGAARTALFNWAFAQHFKGNFLLRIEDTDKKRSTKSAQQSIEEGLEWLGLSWNGTAILQSKNQPRHIEVARGLLANGQAYPCYCTPDELTQMRELAMKKGLPSKYDGRCRDTTVPANKKERPAVLRIKAPQNGNTVVEDAVQGQVIFSNDTMDDFVLLRSDGTPTYMLSVVVDDHDMGITHVIRGVDHLTNAARQFQLYQALGWPCPKYAHIPLIHGSDGAKMSKRHGALDVRHYQHQGYLPDALCNYLARLGWSHGDAEIFSKPQFVQWFNLKSIGKGAARFDSQKLAHLNSHYIHTIEKNDTLITAIVAYWHARKVQVSQEEKHRITTLIEDVKSRATTLENLGESTKFLLNATPQPTGEVAKKYLTLESKILLQSLAQRLEKVHYWNVSDLEKEVRNTATSGGVKLKDIAQPLRVALTGDTVSPGIFVVMEALGQQLTLKRLELSC